MTLNNNLAECRSCGTTIRWCQTPLGKKMPVDIDSVPGGNVDLVKIGPGKYMAKVVAADEGVNRYRSHFASCPNADKHRRAR